MTKNTTAERMRAARESAGFSNKSEFARLIQVRPETVWRYETGQYEASVRVLCRWAKSCGTSLDWLATGEGEGPRRPAEVA
jgi:transcriptional regulator with XRE-family HTH domain